MKKSDGSAPGVGSIGWRDGWTRHVLSCVSLLYPPTTTTTYRGHAPGYVLQLLLVDAAAALDRQHLACMEVCDKFM